MSDIALSMDRVYKKFRKGEVYNSLRDLLPALTGKMFRQQDLSGSDKREFWALQDISFEVRRGESLGIIGPNGAGKSTILKILSRIMEPTRGSIHVNGRLSALIEVSAGFHQDLTGRENIYLNGTILGMTKREIGSKLDQIIAFSGIEEFIDTPVKRYSSGMYARLGFSVAAHMDPDVLIVDEVLSVGDWLFQVKCVERMKEVIRGGAAVVFVSHNLKTVAEFCSRCMLLEKGATVAVGPGREIISTYLRGGYKALSHETDTKPVVISKVTIRDQNGECAHFRAGQKAWVDVELHARTQCNKLSVSLVINDEQFKCIFDTNTERLGYGNFRLDAGQVFMCTFELSLNLANGIFYPSIDVYRYDIEAAYDSLAPAATLYISSDDDVRGAAHCFPKVVQHEICSALPDRWVGAVRETDRKPVIEAR
jgi:ABC-type polysaccharide/polyol phosphate transport system ATPase subunit